MKSRADSAQGVLVTLVTPCVVIGMLRFVDHCGARIGTQVPAQCPAWQEYQGLLLRQWPLQEQSAQSLCQTKLRKQYLQVSFSVQVIENRMLHRSLQLQQCSVLFL